jgi:hypothetical protein
MLSFHAGASGDVLILSLGLAVYSPRARSSGAVFCEKKCDEIEATLWAEVRHSQRS